MKQSVHLARESGLVILTMDAGGRPTCLDVEMCNALLAAFARVDPDAGDRVVVLRSTGRVFSAGGDLFAIESYLEDPDRLLGPRIDRFHDVILAIRALPIPVLAQVHGAAAGAGFSLVLACDQVVAARSSKFVSGYARIGTSSDGGLTFHLARRLGAAPAMALFLTDDSITAERAQTLGLVQRLVEDEAIDEAALQLARSIARQAPQAVRELKALISAAADSGLAAHLELERAAFLRCAKSEDFARLVAQFTRSVPHPTSSAPPAPDTARREWRSAPG